MPQPTITLTVYAELLAHLTRTERWLALVDPAAIAADPARAELGAAIDILRALTDDDEPIIVELEDPPAVSRTSCSDMPRPHIARGSQRVIIERVRVTPNDEDTRTTRRIPRESMATLIASLRSGEVNS